MTTLFNRYRPPAQNDEGIPIVGGDFGPDIGSNPEYGQNNDDSGEDYSNADLYGPPAAQAPPTPPSPNAGMAGAGSAQTAAPPLPIADDAPPPPPPTPARSPYAVKVQQAINNRADMQRPALPKPSIW